MDALHRISQPLDPSVHTHYYNAQCVPLTRTWQQHGSIFAMRLYITATQGNTHSTAQHAAKSRLCL